MSQSFDRSACDLASLYLLSVGTKLLGPEATCLVGISEEATCYVSPDHFERAVDFLVHEAAHIAWRRQRRYWAAQSERGDPGGVAS